MHFFPFRNMDEKYSADNIWVPTPPSNDQKINIFGDMAYEAGSDHIRSELDAYQKKLLDSGSAYVQRNVNVHNS